MKSYEDNVQEELKITQEQFAAIQIAIDKIEVPESILKVIEWIRHYLQIYNRSNNPPMYISDRRWRKMIRLLRTSALLNDRNVVDLIDCFLMTHCIWNEPLQFNTVQNFVKEAIQTHGCQYPLDDIQQEINALNLEIQSIIRQNKIATNLQLKIYTYNSIQYYKIIDWGYYFGEAENDLIKKEIVDSATDDNVIDNIYNKNFRNNLGICIRKSENPFIIKLAGYNRYNTYQKSEFYDCSLETELVENNEIITRKPTSIQVAYWNVQIGKLLEHTLNLKNKLIKVQNHYSTHKNNNLFVFTNATTVIEARLSEIYKAIEKLEITIKKMQHDYQSVSLETVNLTFEGFWRHENRSSASPNKVWGNGTLLVGR